MHNAAGSVTLIDSDPGSKWLPFHQRRHSLTIRKKKAASSAPSADACQLSAGLLLVHVGARDVHPRAFIFSSDLPTFPARRNQPREYPLECFR